MMKVVLNGKLVRQREAVVSVFDRGFLYGDGLFETLRLYQGRPFRCQQHWDRLQRGAAVLNLPLALDPPAFRRLADELVVANRMPDSVLRIAVSRGIGQRGYLPQGAGPSTLIMSLHPPPILDPANPPCWRLMCSSWPVPAGDHLAATKHASRLVHVLASAEAAANGFDDALLVNSAGQVAEATASNLFWIENGIVCTPPLSSGALAGVTRGAVMEICAALGLPTQERLADVPTLKRADGVFLTQTVWEVVSVHSIGRHRVTPDPIVSQIQAAYRDLVQRETTEA